MYIKLVRNLLLGGVVVITATACGQKNHNDNQAQSGITDNAQTVGIFDKNKLRVDIGAEVTTLDPQLVEDTQSSRVVDDLFEGLMVEDQSNKAVAGLAKSWEISPDGKTYTFHLRNNIKFSDGSPINASDFVYTFQRLVDPKTGSAYTYIAGTIQNANDISNGRKPKSELGVTAVDNKTLVIKLNHPDSDFLSKLTMQSFEVVSQKNIEKFGRQWIDPANMISSGAYELKEHVVNGHILAVKNPYYYNADKVKIANIYYYPLVDVNGSVSKYKAGGIELTWTIPVDQVKAIKSEFGSQLHITPIEAMVYYNINMLRPEFKDVRLRQALSMAVDRNVLVNEVLGTGVVANYSVVTASVEGGKYRNAVYAWKDEARDKQIAQARELYKDAGYGIDHELNVSILYFTNDEQKKVALAIASMWKSVLGANVTVQNEDWKTFVQARHKGEYQISMGRWYADYNGVSTYTQLYMCNGAQNDTKYCNPLYDKYINSAALSTDANLQQKQYLNGLNIALNDYETIPLYQMVSERLIKPYVKGYTPDTNHLDLVWSKWFTY